MAATPAKITTPIIGACLDTQYSPAFGSIAASADADSKAQFPLGTPGQGMKASSSPGVLDAQFVRASATIAAAGTAGVTAGVFGGTAGAGNTWTNNTPQACVIGNYLWVTGTPVEG